jgi:hypothetical protein
MATHKTEHMKANEFRLALDVAHPGDTFVYATGFIAWSMHEAKDHADLAALQLAAYGAHLKGNVALTQNRLGPFQFEYRATKRANGTAP